MSEPRPYLLSSFLGKNHFFDPVKNRIRPQLRRSEPKSHIAFSRAINPGLLYTQKVLPQHFLLSQVLVPKDIFIILSLTAFLGSTPAFLKKKKGYIS